MQRGAAFGSEFLFRHPGFVEIIACQIQPERSRLSATISSIFTRVSLPSLKLYLFTV